eukprot:22931-Ditylum_brightwellii.AAC.1
MGDGVSGSMMIGCLDLVEHWCGWVGWLWSICGNVGLVSSTLGALLLRCSVGGEGAGVTALLKMEASCLRA